ncbi:MAG: OST3/OST6 family protein [Candidatus Bathyarchaeota archaeon]|nr:OST3/OST6 family protein [Candidatus Termiticorpusculum sp.]
MTKKNKKQQLKQKPAPTTTQSSVSSSLSKWFKKVVTTQPFALIITVVLIGATVFLLGGGLYTMTTENVMPSLYYNNRFYFLSPWGMSEQFISETIITIMLYIMGFAGLLSVYQSTKNASKPRQAYILLLVGASLILLSYVCLESAINIKSAGF